MSIKILFGVFLVYSVGASLLASAHAQELPGANGEPDYVRPFRAMQRNIHRAGDVPAFHAPQNVALDTAPDAVCSSASLRQIISDALQAQTTGVTASSPRQAELKDRQTKDLLAAIQPDNSQDAQALQKQYGQLPAEQRLGTFRLCAGKGSDRRVTFHAALFINQNALSGAFTVGGIGWPPYVFHTFGGLTHKRYQQLSQSLKSITTRPVAIVAGSDNSLCSKQSVRQQASQAVNDKILMSGLPASPNMYASEFNKLRVDNSAVSGAIKRAFKRQRPEFAEVEVCIVPFNQPGLAGYHRRAQRRSHRRQRGQLWHSRRKRHVRRLSGLRIALTGSVIL